jgi:FAD/FMN-containing dehydrogenase
MTTNLLLGVALDEIAQTIGPEHVLISGESFEQRARDTTPSVQRPAGFVFPDSVEAVQAIVRIANRHAIALWPVSKGKNWGYGAATPVYAGALIMVLERMNRILEVNEELAYTVIEPGVTYGQLNRYGHDGQYAGRQCHRQRTRAGLRRNAIRRSLWKPVRAGSGLAHR